MKCLLNGRLLPSFLILTLLVLGSVRESSGATTIDFGALSGLTNDIVNAATSGANVNNGPVSFDVLDCSGVLPCVLGTDGIDDLSISFAIITEDATDLYGGGTLDPLRGTTHDITQQTNGFRGSTPIGNSGSNQSTTGDVQGVQITVDIASHLSIQAQDFTVNQESVNTVGEVFESGSVVFNDANDTPYGSATYSGFWNGAPMGSNGGTNTTNIASSPYTTTGTGVYLAANTGVVDVTTSTDPTAGTAAASDNLDPNASTDAGLNATDLVGGFTWTVLYEDVATTATDDAQTSTDVTFTARLASIEVTAVPEPSSFLFLSTLGCVFAGGRSFFRRNWRS